MGYWPPYAHSSVEGEIWPMIAEKIWAKMTGSYANAEAGASSWIMEHLTGDPSVQISTSNLSYEKLWWHIKVFSDREYMQFVGTHKWAWVGNHAFVVLRAEELELNGENKRIVKLRNPWGKTDWKGAYSEGTPEYEKLNAKLTELGRPADKEGGLFFMELKDM